MDECIARCEKHVAEYKMPLAQCIKECHDVWPADPLAGLPTRANPTPNGWYITMEEDRNWGIMYNLHSTMDRRTTSVFETIPKLHGDSIGWLWLHNFKGIDLPILGYISSGGYALSIDNKKLVWKRGHTLIPYLYGGKEPDD